ncbi:MAG: preprotein translocase subunit SecE [Kiritimatiellia bacterium]|jgi:preprotein translocase SecE subunit
MGKVQSAVTGTKTFLGEVQDELKKCAWPTQGELVQSTWVVIISVFILAAVVSVSDLVLMNIMRLVIR